MGYSRFVHAQCCSNCTVCQATDWTEQQHAMDCLAVLRILQQLTPPPRVVPLYNQHPLKPLLVAASNTVQWLEEY